MKRLKGFLIEKERDSALRGWWFEFGTWEDTRYPLYDVQPIEDPDQIISLFISDKQLRHLYSDLAPLLPPYPKREVT